MINATGVGESHMTVVVITDGRDSDSPPPLDEYEGWPKIAKLVGITGISLRINWLYITMLNSISRLIVCALFKVYMSKTQPHVKIVWIVEKADFLNRVFNDTINTIIMQGLLDKWQTKLRDIYRLYHQMSPLHVAYMYHDAIDAAQLPDTMKMSDTANRYHEENLCTLGPQYDPVPHPLPLSPAARVAFLNPHVAEIDRQIEAFRESQKYNTKIINTSHTDFITDFGSSVFTNFVQHTFTRAYLKKHKCADCGGKSENRCHGIGEERPILIRRVLKRVWPDTSKEIALNEIMIAFLEEHKYTNFALKCRECHVKEGMLRKLLEYTAKETGHDYLTPSHINNLLYRLLTTGMVTKNSDVTPPIWSLTPRGILTLSLYKRLSIKSPTRVLKRRRDDYESGVNTDSDDAETRENIDSTEKTDIYI